MAQLWPPISVQGDQAFAKKEFCEYLKLNGTEFRPVPSRRHHKNTFEPKHGIIISIFLRLQHASPLVNKTVLALQAVSISNNLYGSDLTTSFEIAKGYSKPLVAYSTPNPISPDLINARNNLLAKRKFNLIMLTKATNNPVVSTGDLVHVYVLNGHDKRVRWSSPQVVQIIDRSAGTVSVPGMNGHTIVAAIEDFISAILDDDLATSIVELIDKLDIELEDALDMDEISAETNPITDFSADFADLNESSTHDISNSNSNTSSPTTSGNNSSPILHNNSNNTKMMPLKLLIPLIKVMSTNQTIPTVNI